MSDCVRPSVSRGWCKMHYYRWARTGDPLCVRPAGFPKRPRLVCKFDGCEKTEKIGCRGWCGMHFTRWYRHGDPSINGNKSRKRRDVLERIRERVMFVESGCWEWMGSRLPNGYGYLGVKNRHEYVHRAVWIYHRGAIPKRMHVHHVCGNRACCNLDHLQLLTPAEHGAAHRKVATCQS